MTGTLYGTAQFHWVRGFFFGSALGAAAAVIVNVKCKAPTREQWAAAVAAPPQVARGEVPERERIMVTH